MDAIDQIRAVELKEKIKARWHEWAEGKITEDELYIWMVENGCEPEMACNMIVTANMLCRRIV